MKILSNVSIAPSLWYKIGGKVSHLLHITTQQDVFAALDFLNEKHITNVLIVGLGSNLIFASEHFDGAVLQFASQTADDIKLRDKTHIAVFAGAILDDVIQFSFAHNLSGLGWAGGLPGTVGAAVRGNVGAFGGEIKDVIEEIQGVDTRNKDIKIFGKKELDFSYRDSFIKQNKNFIVLSAIFRLQSATPEKMKEEKKIYAQNKMYRKIHHPLEYPNCGSIFKNIRNPEDVQKVLAVFPDIEKKVKENWHGKVSMGYLIKRLGFLGKRVGNAQVSEKHPNFIVNRGGATSKDVLEIIAEIQERCSQTLHFTPEVEVEIVR